jgi:hypothetical protein
MVLQRCHVDGRLNGDLQRVKDETSFPDVADDLRRACERAELLHARLDAGELLREEVGVGHRAGTGRRR